MWPRVAAAGVAAHIDAVAVGPLPEREPVGLAAPVADGAARPEPPALEADFVRDEVRDTTRARSRVPLRAGSHLHRVCLVCVHCLALLPMGVCSLLVTRAGIRGRGSWLTCCWTHSARGRMPGPGNGVAGPRACEAASLRVTRGPARFTGSGCEEPDGCGTHLTRGLRGRALNALATRTPGVSRRPLGSKARPLVASRRGKAVLPHWPTVGRAGLDPSGRPGPGWTLRVLRHEPGEARNCDRVS